MPEELYLVVCLRHNNMAGNNFLLFWEPDRNGYTARVDLAGLCTKDEAEKICSVIDDIPLPLSYLDLTLKDLNQMPESKELCVMVIRTARISKWIKQQRLKYQIKERLERKAVV